MIDAPPEKLKLSDRFKTDDSDEVPKAPGPHTPIAPNVAAGPFPAHGAHPMSPFMTPGYGMPNPYYPYYPSHPYPHMSPPNKRHMHDAMSSEPELDHHEERKKKPEFPMIASWLLRLDSDPERGVDNREFGSFAAKFDQHRFIRIDELLTCQPDELVTLCNMPAGTAKKLLEHAQEDVRKVKKDAKRRKN